MDRERPAAIDLFCGAGGLTQGLVDAGFQVVGAVDVAPIAIETYRLNHPDVRLWQTDIRRLAPALVMDELGLEPGELDLLAGCPPCQGFSSMRTHRKGTSVADPRNGLVAQFARFAEQMRPKTLMMENVPGLANDRRLKLLVKRLSTLGYQLAWKVLDAADFGVPQRRRRLVLLGSLDAHIEFTESEEPRMTVREALAGLPAAGESGDQLHDHGEQRSEEVMAIIRDIPHDGGSRSDLSGDRQLACHERSRGWYDVYGRMAWEEPGPTITSGCVNPSKGRFLHPSEDRSITVREAALLQSFPMNYRFSLRRGKFSAADLVGNALPPRFVEHHARSLLRVLTA